VVSFIPWLLYPQEKSPWYLLDRRLGKSQSSSKCSGEEKDSQPALAIKLYNPNHPACSIYMLYLVLFRWLNLKLRLMGLQ
jgi:hypothetical protein